MRIESVHRLNDEFEGETRFSDRNSIATVTRARLRRRILICFFSMCVSYSLVWNQCKARLFWRPTACIIIIPFDGLSAKYKCYSCEKCYNVCHSSVPI